MAKVHWTKRAKLTISEQKNEINRLKTENAKLKNVAQRIAERNDWKAKFTSIPNCWITDCDYGADYVMDLTDKKIFLCNEHQDQLEQIVRSFGWKP